MKIFKLRTSSARYSIVIQLQRKGKKALSLMTGLINNTFYPFVLQRNTSDILYLITVMLFSNQLSK